MNRSPIILLCFGIIVHLGLAIGAGWIETPTADEYSQLPAGLAYLKNASFGVDAKNPPLGKIWAALPVYFLGSNDLSIPEASSDLAKDEAPITYGRLFEAANTSSYLQYFFVARIMIALLSVFTAFLMYLWSRRSLGDHIAALVCCGFLLSPTVLAHSHVATVDIACMFTIFALCFSTRQFEKPKWYQAMIVGSLFGAALATKLTALLVVPVLVVWMITTAMNSSSLAKARLFQCARLVLLILVSVVFILNFAYGFSRPWITPDGLHLVSDQMKQLIGFYPAALPLPVPHDFLFGLDLKLADIQRGGYPGYVLGEWSNEGRWYYYILAFLVKETPLTIALIIAAIGLGLFRRSKQEWYYCGLPVVAILFPLTFFNNQQLGIRYILPIFPFLFILSGTSIKWLMNNVSRSWRVPVGCMLLLSWLISSLWSFPNYLGYFNSPSLAIASDTYYLLDSNLDWGQDLYRLKSISDKNEPISLLYWGETSPHHYNINYVVPDVDHPPKSGVVAISENFLNGYDYFTPTPDGKFIWIAPSHWSWLRNLKFERREGSISIFSVR